MKDQYSIPEDIVFRIKADLPRSLKRTFGLNDFGRSDFSRHVTIEILVGKFKRRKQFVGFLRGTFYNLTGAYNAKINPVSIFDDIDQDSYDMYVALYDQEEESLNSNYISCMSSNIFGIDRLFIEKEFRGKGIASFLIKNLQNLLSYTLNMEIGCFILNPVPLEKQDNGLVEPTDNLRNDKLLNKKLVKFYSNLGFQQIENDRHMYFNTEFIMG